MLPAARSCRLAPKPTIRKSSRLDGGRYHPSRSGARLTIDDFRGKPEYGGDGNRIDLAYAVYALAHGATENEIRSAIPSRDLSKKGPESRQQAYVERTIRKACSTLGR
jgi:hypothetical protein